MKTTDLLFEWLENYEKDRVKARTYSRYRSIIDLHLVPTLGDIDVGNLSRRQIKEFLSQKKKDGNIRSGETMSSASTNLMLTVLNMAFEYGLDMEICDNNPCLRLKRCPDDCRKVEAFTVEEQRKIECYIDSSDDRRLFGIILGLYSGLRIGELLGLEWDDIDYEKGIIKINKTVYRDKNEDGTWKICIDKPKTKASERIIPLPSYIVEQLIKYKETARSIFVVENKKGERMSIRSYQFMFERLTVKAGVRKLNFHALRHTFATRAIECGMDIKTLSEIMGHKNASVTLNRYAHSMLDTKIAMMNKLQRVFK